MKTPSIIILLAATALFLLCSPQTSLLSRAQGPGGPGGPGRPGGAPPGFVPGDYLGDYLGLTSAQKLKLERLVKTMDALSKENFVPTAFAQLKLTEEQIRKMAEGAAVKDVLTPDQQKTLDANTRRGRPGGPGGPGGGRQGGPGGPGRGRGGPPPPPVARIGGGTVPDRRTEAFPALTPKADAPIQWYATLTRGLAEARRTGKPILFVSGAPHCAGVPGMW